MNIKRIWTKWIVGGTVALALAMGTLAVWSSTSAAQTAPQGAPQLEAVSAAQRGPGRGPGNGENRDLYQAALASELGITVDELNDAQEAAREAVTQQLVADGTITQEQADLISAKTQLRDYIDRDALQAEALGITVDELQAARDAGQTLDEILEAEGMDRETYRENMAAARDAALDQAVADGVITAEQAEQLQERAENGRGDGPGRGGRGQNGPDL